MSSDERLANVTTLVRDLVAFDTTPGRATREIADYACEFVARSAAGTEISRHEYADGDKVNLVIRKGPVRERAGLLLSGHLDVVPANEPEWTTDPFSLRESDGRWFGRGATDMKTFVALALDAFVRFDPTSANAPLVLFLTSDEEIGSLGVQAWLRENDAKSLPRHAIIGEPTSGRVVRMHKGHLKVRFAIAGRAAHSGLPHRGDNAIRYAGPLLAKLEDLRARWEMVRVASSECFTECPYPALNVGMIRGGRAVNIVPDSCVIDVGVRLLPGMNSDDALRELDACVAALGADDARKITMTVVNDSPPMLCDAESTLYQQMARICEQDVDAGVSFSSDAGVLSRAGVDCVLWGPGTMDDAHCANESIATAEVVAAQQKLSEIVAAFCTSAAVPA